MGLNKAPTVQRKKMRPCLLGSDNETNLNALSDSDGPCPFEMLSRHDLIYFEGGKKIPNQFLCCYHSIPMSFESGLRQTDGRTFRLHDFSDLSCSP